MRIVLAVFIAATLATMNAYTQTASDLATIWDKEHVSTMFPSDVRHSDLKKQLEDLKKLGLRVDEVGRSYADREIYQVEFGKGPLRVFMWTQMHGDEPTATSAVIDMLAYFQTHRQSAWVKQIEQNLTIRVVPMLNPDGAEAFQRRNMQGIDINRDAIDLTTPEARLLKKLRDDWSPAIGFNLHNQQALTTVGRTGRQAAISLLVVYGDAAKTPTDGLERNRRVAAEMADALHLFIPGHIARYDDEYTATAFGDNFSAWGTPVILVETGALYGRDEMYLVKMNFVAFVTAINALATGSERTYSPLSYASLIGNSSGGLRNFVFRHATIRESAATDNLFIADIGVNTLRRRASFTAPNVIRDIGSLSGTQGLEEYDASGFTMVQRLGKLKVGELAEFLFYKKDRVVDWGSVELEKAFPPDAIFSGGKWIKGEGLVPKIAR
ncbi:MAG: M14 family zinc carboxypeptidase [Acidobacteriota bacterium]